MKSLVLAFILFIASPAVAQTLNATPPSLPAGGSVMATWSGIPSPASTDWIGLFATGADDHSYLAWSYANCAKIASVPVASGACSLSVARGLKPGSYELRLFVANDYVLLTTSGPFTVTPAPPIARGTRTLIHTYSVGPDRGVALEVVADPVQVAYSPEFLAPCCVKSIFVTSADAMWEFQTVSGLPETGRDFTVYVTLTGASSSAIVFADVAYPLQVNALVNPDPNPPTGVRLQ